MLLSLSIADFVLVDRLELEFRPGFSVLTGETGAGKSILLGALAMLLGERAEAGVVREGAARAEVAAEFSVGTASGLADWLAAHALAGDDGRLLLRRVVEANGRSRAFVNGRPATVRQLQEAGEFLIDIHGQHAHYSLLKPAEQRRLLDAYAGCDGLAAATAECHRAWRAAGLRRQAAERDAGERAAEREELTGTERELAALAFTSEGWVSLQEEHRRLAHAADLLAGARAAGEALDADDSGLLDRLRALRHQLADLAGLDAGLAGPLALLESAAESLREAARELARYAERVELDPEALGQAEQRLAAIQSVARKLRIRPEEIPARLVAVRSRLAELGADADVAALAAAEAAAEAAYREQAGNLSRQRANAAAELAAAVTRAMQALAMRGGRFTVELSASEPGAHGIEEVAFAFAPHAGQSMQPLAKTASGGELSRLGLALQTVLSGVSGAATLIFDEVDAGIGGGVAEIVGRLLADLGETRQVLCVTHLPQVAARAAHHYRVSKVARAGRTVSQVDRLDAAARVEELARMLGGVSITAATRAHAAEMLAGGEAGGGMRKKPGKPGRIVPQA